MEGEGVCVGGMWIGGLAGRHGDCMRAAFRVLASIIHEPQAFGDIYYSAVTFLCGVGGEVGGEGRGGGGGGCCQWWWWWWWWWCVWGYPLPVSPPSP